MDDRLYRSRSDRMIAGVAGGIAQRYDLDPSLVRVGWAALMLLTGGIFFLLYIVMAIVVPEEGDTAWPAWPDPGAGTAPEGGGGTTEGAAPDSTSTTPPAGGAASMGTAAGTAQPGSRRRQRRATRQRGDGALVVGGVLVVIGSMFLLRQFVPQFDFDLFWPVALIVLGGALVLASVRRT